MPAPAPPPVIDVTVQALDAVRRHREFPMTFEIPDALTIAALRRGRHVKICVADERFWVQIEAIDERGVVGRIDNDLVYTFRHGLRCDDRILFAARHILSVLH